jgi:single-stranded-DNA-specific exonuclease
VAAPAIRRRPPGDASALPDALHPVLRRVYAARAVRSAAELENSLGRLHPPTALGGLERAVDLLVEALAGERRMLIVGDFDADGATSCALMLRALRAFGARHVDYLVPNRFAYGYGLTPEIVEVAARRDPHLLITVDNGISSTEGVRSARARGMRVLITDHHLPGKRLPDADAIVNPNLAKDPFPSKHLAGVGVAFYVMLALRARLRRRGGFEARGTAEPNLARLLDLVALGTVADVVPLDHNNRILVRQGLNRIRAGHCVPGVRALLELAGRQPHRITAADLGFAVAPRLNAAGRLDDMSLGIECLLADEQSGARRMAAALDDLNRERREIEADMQAGAMRAIERLHLEERELPTGLCLFDEAWHQGVIGILASRIRERFHRPVIALAPGEGGELKGSARSIPGLHIRDVLDALAARHPGLISRFGGHAMAAGLSLSRDRYPPFRVAFDEEVRRHLSDDDLQGVIHSDGELTKDELTLDVARALREAGPWGQGFPEPIFDGEFRLLRYHLVGGRHLKLSLVPAGGGPGIQGIAFNAQLPPDPCRRIHLAYRLDVNLYRGIESPQLVVEALEPL